MTYSKEAEKSGWTETTVERITGGINTQERSDLLKGDQVLVCENVRIQRGALVKDTGYKLFGDAGADSQLEDMPQATYQFYKKNGSSELLCITKGSVYVYNTSKNAWEFVKGTASTTLAAGHIAGNTNLYVASSAGFAATNYVGIRMDDGTQYRTTVSAVPDATHITIPSPGLPSAAAGGNVVVRAVILAGSDDFPVSIVTLASHDWVVFTNGENIVKRYNGTDCVDVPGLPSAGNVICAAVLVYNSALFLLRTIEGGTDYPQRVRRSEIGDPTTWSGGTAGYDDLLDSSDYIMSAELLGPYMIVYKERAIYRGQFVNTAGKYYEFNAIVRGEGLAAYQGIIDMGDYHIFFGNSNVYEYRGDFSIEPIGDNVFYNIFSFDADINTGNKIRCFAFFVEELNECWFFITSAAAAYPDILYRYSITEEAWVTRVFANQFVGYGFYQRQTDFRWLDLIGAWSAQTWQWNSRVITAQSPTTLLCAATGRCVWEYDYYTTTDGDSAVQPASIDTRDFVTPDGPFRTDCLEVNLRGTDVTVYYSTDLGGVWNLWGTTSTATFAKMRLYRQVVTDTIRFRFISSDPAFGLRWMNLVWRPESDY